MLTPPHGLELYADTADIDLARGLLEKDFISGLTTNPSLLRASGSRNYRSFAEEVLSTAGSKAVSFEVVADEPGEIVRQARQVAAWGPNVYVKVPIVSSDGESMLPTITYLQNEGIKLNITAVMSLSQVQSLVTALVADVPAIVSVFAGRIADTGRDPVPLMSNYAGLVGAVRGAKLLWASAREILNVVHAQASGCQIITLTPDLLGKLDNWGKPLDLFSQETVQMFVRDAKEAGLEL